jgi:hypothetical protein
MNHDHEHYHKPEGKQVWWKTPGGMAAIFFFTVAGSSPIREHAAHIGNNLI